MKKVGRTYKALNILIVKSTILLILFSLTSCSGNNNSAPREKKNREISVPLYAKRFLIEYKDGYSQLSVIDPWQGARDVLQVWYLVPRGNKLPEGLDPGSVISIPVKKIMCMSTTHLAMIAAIGENSSICGFSGTDFIFDPALCDMVAKGDIKDIGYEDNLDKEEIIKSEPDLIIIYGIGSESAGYISKLRELGIKTMYNADYLEIDPLAKAEWIKVFGALYNKQSVADSIFASVSKKYKDLKAYIRENSVKRPKVLLGLPFRDTWFISPGNSYISKLIDDAGGKYLWSDTESLFSMPHGIESVFLKAIDADYWLNPGSASTKAEITAIDSRLSGLSCFLKGNIFNNNKLVNANGGNDYWESGSLFPNIILRDIASVLHPELFPGNDLYYYKKIK